MKRALFVGGVLLTCLAGAPAAQATILTAPAGATSPGPAFDFSAITVLDVLNSTSGGYSLQSGLTTTGTGTFAEYVVKDANNTFCAGCLDFLIQFTVSTGDGVSRVSTTDFTGFKTDVGYTTNFFVGGGTVAPDSVDRHFASVVGFNMSTAPGDTSDWLVVMTDATGYKIGTIAFQDGGNDRRLGFAPVPGPMLGTGLPGLIAGCLGLFALGRRRRARVTA